MLRAHKPLFRKKSRTTPHRTRHRTRTKRWSQCLQPRTDLRPTPWRELHHRPLPRRSRTVQQHDPPHRMQVGVRRWQQRGTTRRQQLKRQAKCPRQRSAQALCMRWKARTMSTEVHPPMPRPPLLRLQERRDRPSLHLSRYSPLRSSRKRISLEHQTMPDRLERMRPEAPRMPTRHQARRTTLHHRSCPRPYLQWPRTA